MELSVQQQIFDQLRKANKILIALPENLTADSLASGLALKLFLSKQQKDVDLACSGQVPAVLKFLPGTDSVLGDISGGRSFVVSVDTTHKKLEEISYQAGEGKVQVFLKSLSEPFNEQDLSFSASQFPVDVVVVLGASSLGALGKLFERHTDLFFETPKINIDRQPENEYFGAINLVDITATSTAEVLAGLLEQFEAQLLDEDIATCLLAGIITQTHSFQHAHTTPQAFLKASQLVSIGGRQQEIIRHIFRTKPLPLLKLWGRCLARLKAVDQSSLVYSLLNSADFEKSEAGPSELVPVLKEFLENIAGYKVVAVMAESGPQTVRVVAAIHASVGSGSVLDSLHAAVQPVQSLGQFQIFDFFVPASSLAEAEQLLLSAVRQLKLPPVGIQ